MRQRYLVSFAIFLLMTTILFGCSSSEEVLKRNDDVLSYNEFINLVEKAQNYKFDGDQLILAKTSLDKPFMVMVDEEMSFGKKKRFLSLNDEQKDSTQQFIVYKSSNYKLLMTWIYTNANLGKELFMVKPPEAEKPVYDNILAYKNILIHVQLVPLNTKSNLTIKNAEIVISLNKFLSSLSATSPN